MGRPHTDGRLCRWHPKHKLSTGVCPFCVRERLLQLITTSPFSACSSHGAHVYSSTASSSPCSLESDVSSSVSSPQRRLYRYTDHVERARAWQPVKAEAAEGAKLKKSRSLVFEIGSQNELEMEEAGKHKKKGKEKEKEESTNKKKGRFWSKLLLGASWRHSEITWALFS